jgi:hypothetical protein
VGGGASATDYVRLRLHASNIYSLAWLRFEFVPAVLIWRTYVRAWYPVAVIQILVA